MSYMSSEFNSFPVIDDSNYKESVELIRDPSTPFTGGYTARDYNRYPAGYSAPLTKQAVIPRSKWLDHIRRQEDEKSSPDHWRIAGEVPVLDQNGLGYCWMYGTVGCIMVTYAQTGIKAPQLSATGPAAQGKNWRNEGGWAGEALGYIDKFGVPELSVWPEHSMDKSLPGRSNVQASARRHSHVKFQELPRNSFDHLMSALLDPVDPRAVTMGLNWWGHLVYAVKAVYEGGQFGVLFTNSWKITYGKNGQGILRESKATAFEQIKVESVKLRTAA